MGRELKRAPLNFAWTLNKPWKRFRNPLYVATKCVACDGDGLSVEAKRVHQLWYGYAPFTPADNDSEPWTSTDDVVRHVAQSNIGHWPEYYGTSECAIEREAQRLAVIFNSKLCYHLNEMDVADLIAANQLYDFTHTFTPGVGWLPKETVIVPSPREVNAHMITCYRGINDEWAVTKGKCERSGKPYLCGVCNGSGDIWPSPESKAAYETCEKIEPPTGEGEDAAVQRKAGSGELDPWKD